MQRSRQPLASHQRICGILLRPVQRLPHLPYVLPSGGSCWLQDGPQNRLCPPSLRLAAPPASRCAPRMLHGWLNGRRNSPQWAMRCQFPKSKSWHILVPSAWLVDHGVVCRGWEMLVALSRREAKGTRNGHSKATLTKRDRKPSSWTIRLPNIHRVWTANNTAASPPIGVDDDDCMKIAILVRGLAVRCQKQRNMSLAVSLNILVKDG
jgi:hypothetical protein